MKFDRGVPATILETVPPSPEYDDEFTKGTTVTFKPDGKVFKGEDGEPCTTFQAER